jgi:predicted nucleotide-binding protein (sugar kinase/HSP70/actin superfamily)
MSERSKFFKKLRKEKYTILCPDMLPTHFDILIAVLNKEGYNIKIVSPKGREAKDEGLRAIHNDACYPALIVAGQFIAELKSGQYDLDHTAVIMSQTGGGCRASNYISLFRKAFNELFPTVPVLSINFSGLEKDASLPFNVPLALKAVTAVQYGDMIFNLELQTRPYETYPGQVEEIKKDLAAKLKAQIGKPSFMKLKKNLLMIRDAFSIIPLPEKRKPRVAIVGEIYVKYSPYANNNLTEFLEKQDCEVVYPSLSEFVLYCIYNMMEDYRRYGMKWLTAKVAGMLYKHFLKQTRVMNSLIKEKGYFPYEDFEYVVKQGERIINTGVKMGEGWLIPAEMLAYSQNGVHNIVCAQPFGCLPNHIVGKGMVRPLKEIDPSINIVPLDFDASSTQVNQENRLKLMLANLK